MRNKSAIIGITIIVTLLCFYYISFTFVAQGVMEDATVSATGKSGIVNLDKKQRYLDSIYEKPVYNFLGMVDYTYKEVKELELSLGLDLQGGMHVTMEVSPIEILKALAGNNATDPRFTSALTKAIEQKKNSSEELSTIFFRVYKESNGGNKLYAIFANAINRGVISSQSTDADIEKYINKEVDDAVDRSFEILRNRIDKFGAIQPNIQKIPGTDRIQVELPGVENRKRVRALLEGTAQLEFYKVFHPEEIGEAFTNLNKYLLSIEKKDKKDTTATDANLSASTEGDLSAGEDTSKAVAKATTDTAKADTSATAKKDTTENQSSSFFSMMKGDFLRYEVKDTAYINSILAKPEVQKLLPSNLTLLWEKTPIKSKDGEMTTIAMIPIMKGKYGKALLPGEVIKDARAGVAQGGTGYEISMQMNTDGAKKWKKVTAEAAASNPKRRIAIVMDDYVYSAPTVQSEIPNGSSVISGNFTLEEADDLAKILKAGKLPAPVRVVEEVVVGPTLGREAIVSGLSSMLVGMVIVMLFMVLYYNKGGAIADIALVFNIIFILGVMSSFGFVLTLPGIAGIVLTIGMSVDANVLIFERIREELRNGKSLHTAIDLGYSKAFSSIFDSNITTIIIGIILFWLGSGLVKGFALTLIAGIVCSFFTAVYISKVILLYITKGKDEKSISFDTFISKNLFQDLNFNIIGKRKIAYVFSSALIIFGLVTVYMQGGLNLGVDFKGGRSYVVQFKKDVSSSDVKNKLSADFVNASTEVKTFGNASKLKITTSYLSEDESAEADAKVEQALAKGLDAFSGKGSYEVQYSNKVGATVADDIKTSSWRSMIISLVCIFVYILIRFKKWQFSLGGVVALLHDSLMIICIFSILRLFGIAYEVDQVFVAAILTIIGFSINDTVIVFDRVREFTLEQGHKYEMATVLNNSINHTLSRTIMTTFTVLVVVVILFLFGGETLRGFSFALLIGVVFGSYSTIFIAVPMVLDIRSKKEKEHDAQIVKQSKQHA